MEETGYAWMEFFTAKVKLSSSFAALSNRRAEGNL